MVLPVVLIIIGLINLLLGITVFARRYQHLLHQSFLLLTIGVGLWSLAIGFYFLTNDPGRALFYVNVYYAAALLIASSLFTFSFSLRPNQASVTTSMAVALAVPFIYSVAATFNPELLLHINGLHDDIVLQPVTYTIYAVSFGSLFLTAIARLGNEALKAAPRRRKQLFVVFFGVAIAGFVGMLFNLVLPALHNYRLIWIGPACSLAFLVSTSYAVVRYRLFDLRLALARALAYLISLFWVIIAYAFILFLVGLTLFGQTNVSTLQNLVYLGLAVLLTFTFQPLKNFFDKFTSHLFFRKPLDQEAVIARFNDFILSEVELSALSSGVFKIIDDTFKPMNSALWIDNPLTNQQETIVYPVGSLDDHRLAILITKLNAIKRLSYLDVDDPANAQELKLAPLLSELNISLMIRMQTTKRQLGYLIIGHRQSGDGYGSLDRSVLMTVADELALAIENSLQFQQITEFNKMLQMRINDSTKELRASNRKLHDLDKSKDEFISMASHQLRTPLTTVKGYISMLLDGDVGELTQQQRTVLEEAFDSSQRMVFLISDFLNVSRVQAGKFELEESDVDLAEVVAQEVRQLQDSARLRKMTIEYERPTDIPIMRLDDNKIRQVIMNFIDNAVYYSKAGDTINVSLTRRSSHISLRVIDHGIGVPAGERHKLFSKFFRASNARKQRPDGTGIGLFMARKVIVAHGGSVIFETQEGQGSTFGFRLPLGTLKDQTH